MRETPNKVRTRGYPPHVEGAGYVQHVVFRTADALPESVLDADFPDERARIVAVERWLDAGHGACPLAKPRAAEIVVSALTHFAGARYALHAYAVMPNHVHVLVEPFREKALSEILKSWKIFTARRILPLTGGVSPFWAREWFDRFMRDEEHYRTTIRYIENNPVKAGLCGTPGDWRWSSATSP